MNYEMKHKMMCEMKYEMKWEIKYEMKYEMTHEKWDMKNVRGGFKLSTCQYTHAYTWKKSQWTFSISHKTCNSCGYIEWYLAVYFTDKKISNFS